MIKEIVVVGGGTAGWLTALAVHARCPDKNITLIESDTIGIIGAGEGTVPNIWDTLTLIDVSLIDLIKHAGCTIKNGIKFTGWSSNTEEYYYHSFTFAKNDYFAALNVPGSNSSEILTYIYNNNQSLIDVDFIGLLNEECRVPLEGITENRYHQSGAFAIHMNARKFAEYLAQVGQSRGIKRTIGTVKGYGQDINGNISNVYLDDGEDISVDFVFDCTGQHRGILGKTLNVEWYSLEKHLPVDSAIPFFVPYKDVNNLPPYTESRALRYGWMWKIPVEHRYGCGYVYDSSFIDADAAREEIRLLVGNDIDLSGQFKFKSGFYKKTFYKNCVAIGLAQGFLEPLEATSIMMSTMTLLDVLDITDNLNNINNTCIDLINDAFCKRMIEVRDFVYFHYMTNRNDTEFWKNFTVNNEIPDTLLSRINTWSREGLTYHNTNDELIFGYNSWANVGMGIGFFDRRTSNNRIDISVTEKHINNLKASTQKYLKHGEFLQKWMIK